MYIILLLVLTINSFNLPSSKIRTYLKSKQNNSLNDFDFSENFKLYRFDYETNITSSSYDKITQMNKMFEIIKQKKPKTEREKLNYQLSEMNDIFNNMKKILRNYKKNNDN